MEKCVYMSSRMNTVVVRLHGILGGRSLQLAGAVLLLAATAWAQTTAAPAARPSDTVISPVGAIAGQPAPDTGPYDAPETKPVTLLNTQLPRRANANRYTPNIPDWRTAMTI